MQLVNYLNFALSEVVVFLAYIGGPLSQSENYLFGGLKAVGDSLIQALATLPTLPGA